MSFLAKFRSTRVECDGLIGVDDLIEAAGSPASGLGYRHSYCPDGPDDAADQAALALPRCGRCFTHHAGEC